MDATFSLKGLDCPNCASRIERDTAKLEGVEKAKVNLIKQTLRIWVSAAHASEVEQIHEAVERIVHSYEPDVEVVHHDCTHDKDILPPKCCDCPHCHECEQDDDEDSPWRLRRLIAGGILALVSIAAYYIFEPAWMIILPPIVVSYLILGYDVLKRAGRNILKGRIFDENFLMTVATLGAFAIGEYPEAVAVMLFYQIGEYFQDTAVGKSRRAINSLLDIRPDMARVMRNGEMIEVSPEEVAIGETIVVKPGERIALDGTVIHGNSELDTRALTGESLPREVKSGDTVLSGCINQTAALTIEVTKAFGESTASRIVEMVENAANRKAPAEQFITRFARYYTPIVVAAAAAISIIPVLAGFGEWTDWLRRGCVFLVISCPCAIVISVPLTFFGGIGAASRRGILVKGSNYLEALNRLDAIVFDKTGTITHGNFEVVGVHAESGHSEGEIIATAATGEVMSNHPIARAILREAERRGIEVSQPDSSDAYSEIAGSGIHVTHAQTGTIDVGNEKLMVQQAIGYTPCTEIGTKVYVAKDGHYMGCIVIADEIKTDTVQTIQNLKKTHVHHIAMLTGDDASIAQNIAQKAGIDEFYAGLLPEQKVEKLETLSKSHAVAFVGDGINDAPVLARADVGIAMGGLGADAAIEAADIVLMTDEPAKLLDALSIASRTHNIVMQNIVFAIGVKVLFLALGALGLIGLWPAVFADVGVMVLAVLNAMRMLRQE